MQPCTGTRRTFPTRLALAIRSSWAKLFRLRAPSYTTRHHSLKAPSMPSCSRLCQILETSSMPSKGTYTLLLWLAIPRCIRVGRLGVFEFPKGYYTYTGSAKRGLKARLHRHLHGAETKHWHIDYLRPYVRVLGWQCYAQNTLPECRLNGLLAEWGKVIVARFGSSDCRCPSHLLHYASARRPPWRIDRSS